MSTVSKGFQRPLLLGGHAVLDFLNTLAMVDGKLVDSLQSNAHVLRWLARVKLGKTPLKGNNPALLRPARLLRETVRMAIEHIRAGKQPDLTVLNDFLAKSSSHLELVCGRGRKLKAERRWQSRTAEQVLGPLAAAAAELLVTGEFELIRRCEDPSCVLWFYDRTKSHHRRWCSTATCGNRSKVAAFRRRQRAERSRPTRKRL